MYLCAERVSAFVKDSGFGCVHAFSTSSQGGNFLIHSLFCQLLFVSAAYTGWDLLSAGREFPWSLYLCLGCCSQEGVWEVGQRNKLIDQGATSLFCVLRSRFSGLSCRSAAINMRDLGTRP